MPASFAGTSMLARLACHADFSILAAAEATLSGGNYRCISCGSVDGLEMFLCFCHEVDDPNEFERLFQLAGVKRQGFQAELLAIHDFSTYSSHIRHLSTTLSSSFADRHLPKTTAGLFIEPTIQGFYFLILHSCHKQHFGTLSSSSLYLFGPNFGISLQAPFFVPEQVADHLLHRFMHFFLTCEQQTGQSGSRALSRLCWRFCLRQILLEFRGGSMQQRPQ
jgi:hypothetical protein